ELVRHSVAEEAEVYPAVKDKVSEKEAEQARKEHAEAELTMKRLERLKPEDFTQDELDALGSRVKGVKALAPTRPHPSAPDRPPGDLLLGPVVGLFDRLRDAASKRGTEH